MRKVTLGLLAPAAVAMGLCLGALPAQAASGVMQQCSTQYKADKAAGKLKAGETWTKYYAACAKQAKANTPPEPGTKAAKKAEKAGKSNKALTPAQVAAHKRIKECGAMWKKDKAAGKIKKGETWPQYWHSCSDKLKKAG